MTAPPIGEQGDRPRSSKVAWQSVSDLPAVQAYRWAFAPVLVLMAVGTLAQALRQGARRRAAPASRLHTLGRGDRVGWRTQHPVGQRRSARRWRPIF
ncbi:hypothetical protein A8926_5162 [Saccharopolyspora spinosa]|uniref:Uncharacterized protein n=1 Tax=Saccharopolyspora spinosa TaxID=60894 RepID=A0A2N3Y2U2_SACSN|nr:hypothetical protein A8926_5162 [Saccharopolyspora spinosa]